MLSFLTPAGRFNYRVGAIVSHRGRLLLHRDRKDAFWTTPGGRVEFGEDAATALAREMMEELGVGVEVRRPMWVAENFFTYRGTPFHELLVCFTVILPPDAPFLGAGQPFAGLEAELDLEYAWIDPADRSQRLRPDFLRDLPPAPPDGAVWLTDRDSLNGA